MPQQAIITVDASQQSPLRRIWRYVGYDELNYTDTPDGVALLNKLGAMGDAPYFIRAHYLLCSGNGEGRPKWGSSNAYTESTDGEPIYDWTIVDRVLDAILDAGCVPFVEVGFMPEALSSAPDGTPYDTLQDGGWRYPPRDYARWGKLVSELAAHCLERYGLREVRRWYWELWNEPDIFYWAGTHAEYCRLYDHTVAGIVEAIPSARVGGPGTTNPASERARTYLVDFLEHCAHGTNAVTGETGTRLDFVSFHTKGGGYRPSDDAPKQTPTMHQLVRNVVEGLDALAQFPEFAGREVILTEADPDGMAAYGIHENANLMFRNLSYYASYLAMAACRFSDLKADGPNHVDGMLTWAFQFEGRELFEGLRTLSTRGVDKPVLNALRMLSSLGPQRLDVTNSLQRPIAAASPDDADTPVDLAALAAMDGRGAAQILLVTHHDDWDARDTTAVQVSVHGLDASRRYVATYALVDPSQNNSHTLWQKMGSPQEPTDEQVAELVREGQLTRTGELALANVDGALTLSLDLAAHAVCLVEVLPMD